MKKIRNYKDFISEDLFSFLGKNINQKKNKSKNHIDSCVSNILEFLKSNQIENWDDFMLMTPFDREVIDKLINSEVKKVSDLKEVRFEIRLKLSNKKQLKDMLIEYEGDEEYEKCSKILRKINNTNEGN